MNLVTIIIVLYFIVMILIGLWVRKLGVAETAEGYLLGGRMIGPVVTAFTLQSTSMSGYMFLGAGSETYNTGYWGLWYAIGDVGGGITNLSIIGRRMRRLSKILGSLTSIEYLEHRYQHTSVRAIAAAISIFFMALYVFAQFISAGKGLALVTGLDYKIALIFAVACIIFYTVMGGYFAVAYTDFIQGCIMIFGIQLILWTSIGKMGGFTAMNHLLAKIDPTYLSIWGKDLIHFGQWGVVAGAVGVFAIGYMGWPHVVVRHLAMDSPYTARIAGIWSTAFNLMFVVPPYVVGLAAIVLLPQLYDPEMAIFETAILLLHPVMVGIVMAGILAAIMSTADSLLLQTGSIAARDIFQRFIKPDISEKGFVAVSRGMVLLAGIVGVIVAIYSPPGVFALVVFATGVLGNAFMPSYIGAVYWKRANWQGCVASMLMGAISNTLWTTRGWQDITGLHPFFAGLILSTITYVVVSLLFPPPSLEIQEAVDQAQRIGLVPEVLERGAALEMRVEAKHVAEFIKERRQLQPGW
ncbi:MAG TPA: sodium/proline symporter [Firmicutes bacterium]|nr:sodium/proline symporter [Bacillota bacterium]